MLSKPWENRKSTYEFIVVGSGYGGSIMAARLAAALNQPHAVCVLERGKEWQPGEFPDDIAGILRHTRSSANPLGLYEFLTYRDISVIKGSGLGGTSLINANVAVVPDPEIFELPAWPRSVRYEEMKTYFERALKVLGAKPAPGVTDLFKFKALDRRAQQLGKRAQPLNIAVNFEIDGPNPYGVEQHPCNKCGDCITGCNFRAKNTLAMNYLPMAAAAGADIFTQVKVEWIEKLGDHHWRVHGRRYKDTRKSERFTLEARHVVLAAGSINTTEILLRSEMHGLKVSPALGTCFGGNGDFFGLAYNGDFQTDVLGYGRGVPKPGDAGYPGPSIVGVVRYNGGAPPEKRITIEDFSFPSAYVAAAKAVFAAIRGEDTVLGNEAAQQQRIARDFNPSAIYAPDGALNHTMLYLVMGHDDARGTMKFDAPWYEPDGRMTIEWDQVGQQLVFRRMDEELRRHARALGANYISHPVWNIFRTRHLVTAHPLGGCPMGEDHMQGAVDEFGRVFASDGSIHGGLFVADGAIIPSAVCVNPFLTICALAERIAERKIEEMNGRPYPQRTVVSMAGTSLDPLDVIHRTEAELEKLFRRCPSTGIETLVNRGGVQIDTATMTIRNDDYWKGFFPKGHILNAMSSAIFTGFKKTFQKRGKRYVGITSDTDGRITAHNTLEEIEVSRKTGTLEPGKYVLLKYLDPQWAAFYDILKPISDDLVIGRVYLGQYPNGMRLFTFVMSRKYGFGEMTVADHQALFESGTAPTKEELNGVWQMDLVSNNNRLGRAAYLAFDLRPDGRLEARYRLMGLFEGLVIPSFAQDHFQLNDFTPFRDEIRKVTDDFFVGRYITGGFANLPSLLNGPDLGLLHAVPGSDAFGVYYTLSRTGKKALPTNSLLAPFLDARLPDGVGMTFDETMTGWFFEGASEAAGKEGDLRIADRIPRDGAPKDGVEASFQVRITVRDVNEFIDGLAHEAGMSGSITFARFQGTSNVTFPLDEQASSFQYLVVNHATGEAEMRYHLVFHDAAGTSYLLEGRKYMERSGRGGAAAIRELLYDYTTLYCRVYRLDAAGSRQPLGLAYLKFRTFEDLAAVGNLAGFLASFRVTGTADPALQLQARMRFLAFTGQFVQREYDPLSPDIGRLDVDVEAEVRRGADTPDYFTTRPTSELHAILRETQSLPLERLLNTGARRIDLTRRRVIRDIFWKGSFAADTLLGWEERLRNQAVPGAERAAAIFARGSFWKRFDRIENGRATGHVVNYDLEWLPGDPEVREVEYPDDNRRYFKKGDRVLLLTYRNDPYRIVYDTIKLIDEDNAIGVMHLGDFPNGIEFAAFVMSRHNYPLEHMSIEDHEAIFNMPGVEAVEIEAASAWEGNLVPLEHPGTSLLRRIPDAPVRIEVDSNGNRSLTLEAGGSKMVFPHGQVTLEVRRIDADTLLGKAVIAAAEVSLAAALRNYASSEDGRLVLRCLVNRAARAESGAAGL
ncbi:MAG TPA: GMC family oxidoreductase [Bryobacteraceae bacterium]|nr:GMC family oxidoreductase [Bryobacteraceae bacterium]HPU74281.1 GMC family oxidoreductase [Bryobacteraceae bacterium]